MRVGTGDRFMTLAKQNHTGSKIQHQVTAVVVTYNSSAVVDFLATSLNSLENVIVVDNASQDGTVEKIRALAPHVNLIGNNKNLGFGAANNRGAQLVKTPYILFINPDCRISDDMLCSLLKTAEEFPTAGIIAPQGYYKGGNVQISYRQAYYEKRTPQEYIIPDSVCSVKWVHGCCLLVRTDVFRMIDGFDERFFLYYEEDDLCLKVIAAGYECLIEPRSEVLHLGAKSTAGSPGLEIFKHFHYARSRYLITRKYQGIYTALIYRFKILVLAPFAICFYFILNKKVDALKWLGWGEFAWNLRIFL